MKLITATVKGSPREVNTKFGRRAVMDVLTASGETIPIWGPEGYQAVLNRCNGETVTISIDSKGKYHVIENETEPSPINSTKPAAISEGMSPEQKTAIASYVTDQARLFGFCLKQAQAIEGMTPEDVRPTATTLYLQAVKHFSL